MAVGFSRAVGALAAVVIAAGCAPEYPSPLSTEVQQTYFIEEVDIYVSDDAWVDWPVGEQKVKEQFGISTEPRFKAGTDARDEPQEVRPPEIDVKRTDWGREALQKLARDRFEELVKPRLLGSLSGTKPAHMSVVLASVVMADPGVTLFIGPSDSTIYAGFQVFDKQTGEPLSPKSARLARVVARGGLIETLIQEGFDLNFDYTAMNYGGLVKEWIEATDLVMIPEREDLLTFKEDIPGPVLEEVAPTGEEVAEPTS
ncbi:MAG: hypothetical protein AAGC79_10710 [Pseudomonadota bacterium]